MQVWNKDIGTVGLSFGSVRVYGDHGELYAWAHRSGASWPVSELARLDRVCAELDPSNGDLVDLTETRDGRMVDGGDSNLSGDELTAWIDDNLAGTPFAHLAHNLQPCRACQTPFPYDPDADYCPSCASLNAGDVV